MAYMILLAVAVLVAIDQLIKYWAVTQLSQTGTIPLIDGVLHFTYVENRGAAFSILSGKQPLLIVMTAVMIGVGIWLLFSGRLRGKFLMWSTGLVIAGGAGNLVDRIWNGFRFSSAGDGLTFWERLGNGFVVDYIDFRAINFAVFNFADCCVVIGTILIAAYILVSDGKRVKAKKSLKGPHQEE